MPGFDELMKPWQTAKEKHSKSDTLWEIRLHIWRLFRKLIQNLTLCKIFNSNHDRLLFLKFKIWQVFLDLKSDALYCFQFGLWHVEKFNSNSCFLKSTNMQSMSLLRIKLNQNLIIWIQTIFKKVTCRNPTICVFFNPKSDEFWNY